MHQSSRLRLLQVIAEHLGSGIECYAGMCQSSWMLTRTSSGSLTASGPAMASKQELRAAGVRTASPLSSLHVQSESVKTL